MKNMHTTRSQEIVDYDNSDTASFVKADKPLRLSDIGVSLLSTTRTIRLTDDSDTDSTDTVC